MPMEFVDAVRLVYNLANGMELPVDAAATPELRYEAECQGEALDLLCEWLRKQPRR